MMKKASKEDILQRIGGLNPPRSWGEGPARERPEQGSSVPDAADLLRSGFAIVARQVINNLRDPAPHAATVFQLVESLKVGADDLLPVVRWMTERDYVKLLERPANGDWKIESGPKAEELFR